MVSDVQASGSERRQGLTLGLGDLSDGALDHVEVVLVLESASLLGGASLGGKDAGGSGLTSLALVEEGVVAAEEGRVVEGELCRVVERGEEDEGSALALCFHVLQKGRGRTLERGGEDRRAEAEEGEGGDNDRAHCDGVGRGEGERVRGKRVCEREWRKRGGGKRKAARAKISVKRPSSTAEGDGSSICCDGWVDSPTQRTS